MKNKKILTITIVLLAMLLLGIGYANLTNVPLTISGDATANPDAANFDVKFTGTPEKVANVTEAKIVADNEATIKVEGLTAAGQTAVAKYTISNASADLSAELTATATAYKTGTEEASDYFEVTTVFGTSNATTETITKGKDTTVTVTVKLIKTPIGDANVTGDIKVNLTAKPVQPTV